MQFVFRYGTISGGGEPTQRFFSHSQFVKEKHGLDCIALAVRRARQHPSSAEIELSPDSVALELDLAQRCVVKLLEGLFAVYHATPTGSQRLKPSYIGIHRSNTVRPAKSAVRRGFKDSTIGFQGVDINAPDPRTIFIYKILFHAVLNLDRQPLVVFRQCFASRLSRHLGGGEQCKTCEIVLHYVVALAGNIYAAAKFASPRGQGARLHKRLEIIDRRSFLKQKRVDAILCSVSLGQTFP